LVGFADEVREILKGGPVEAVPSRLDQILFGIEQRVNEATEQARKNSDSYSMNSDRMTME
jgi:hypothetical protein